MTMVWDAADVTRLREEWDKGTSTQAIARLFRVSKNAIVGKVHRLDLDARPSPIRRDPNSPPRPIPSIPRIAMTLPPLVSELEPPAPKVIAPPPVLPLTPWTSHSDNPAGPLPMPIPVAANPMPTAAVPDPTPQPEAVPIPRAGRRQSRPCCWVTDVSTAGRLAVFCEAESLPGKPYCDEHSKRAFVRIRERGVAGPAQASMGVMTDGQ